eukprot:CAMPEP_0181324222 /NCGR_PEP_ID=MMETSP1101-20121128/20236_1 /TAXON_ID=46948 /ORGANISM="Rhodomonas abbreviata, Strain Caron Lab Isolate" /LENGTH=314 /DNA_ID=CAMNT_0023432367 /DNA_START=98 /DNA_END=1039 /DNA_ORIENTATION=+
MKLPSRNKSTMVASVASNVFGFPDRKEPACKKSAMVGTVPKNVFSFPDGKEPGGTSPTQRAYRSQTSDLITQLDRILCLSSPGLKEKKVSTKPGMKKTRARNVVLRELVDLLSKIWRDDESLQLASNGGRSDSPQAQTDRDQVVVSKCKAVAESISLAALDTPVEENLGSGLQIGSFNSSVEMGSHLSVPADVQFIRAAKADFSRTNSAVFGRVASTDFGRIPSSSSDRASSIDAPPALDYKSSFLQSLHSVVVLGNRPDDAEIVSWLQEEPEGLTITSSPESEDHFDGFETADSSVPPDVGETKVDVHGFGGW